MLSPTQQSCALVAAHTVLFAAGGCACGLLAKRIGIYSKKKVDDLDAPRFLFSVLLPAATCAAIAWALLPSQGKIWASACLCDPGTPGARKYLIEYVDKYGRLLGPRTVHALSSDLFHKYVANDKFYRTCSVWFGMVAYGISSLVAYHLSPSR